MSNLLAIYCLGCYNITLIRINSSLHCMLNAECNPSLPVHFLFLLFFLIQYTLYLSAFCGVFGVICSALDFVYVIYFCSRNAVWRQLAAFMLLRAVGTRDTPQLMKSSMCCSSMPLTMTTGLGLLPSKQWWVLVKQAACN